MSIIAETSGKPAHPQRKLRVDISRNKKKFLAIAIGVYDFDQTLWPIRAPQAESRCTAVPDTLLFGPLFYDQVILDGFYPFDALGDFACFIDGLLSINEAAQLHGALVSFDTDLE